MEYVISIIPCVIAVFALIISAGSFWWTYKTSVQPVLVFFNDDFSPEHNTTWSVQNVGNGPALNIVLCSGLSLHTLDEEVCAKLPAIAPGGKERLSFVKTRLAFVATYNDLHGFRYTTTCYDSTNVLSSRNHFPHLNPNLPHAWTKNASAYDKKVGG